MRSIRDKDARNGRGSFRNVTGAERFVRSVADRSRWGRPARVPGAEPHFLRLGRPMDAPSPVHRVIRIEPHLHLRFAQSVFGEPLGAKGRGRPPSVDRVRRARTGNERNEASMPSLKRAVLRHPVLGSSLDRAGRAPLIESESGARRVWRRWTTVVEESVRKLVRRLEARSDRIDAVTTTGVAHRSAPAHPAPETARPTARPLPPVRVGVPVRRVVRQALPETAEQTRRLTSSPAPDVVPMPVRKHGATPSGQLGVNVEKLTDQVVKAIDRRIVAHRERLGRI